MQAITPVIQPQTPLPSQPVAAPHASGTQENNNLVFKPLDESHRSDRSENQRHPNNRPNDVEERESLRREQSSNGDNDSNRDVESDSRQESDAHQEQQRQQDLTEIKILAARDREVHAHEQAHSAVGGQYAGAPSYSYERGPDGRAYAVSGEVSIDISKIPDNPQATLIKADQVRRAALAPAEPSAQDRQVAAQAMQVKLTAQSELAEQVSQELRADEVADDGSDNKETDIETEKTTTETEEKPNAAERFSEQNSQSISLNQRINELSASQGSSGQQVNQFV